jgi:transcription-repair coupling factor (superfamily II helicase)
MIPEDYVPDLAVRMALYRRLNDARTRPRSRSLAAEMIDRFGPLPGDRQPRQADRDQAPGDRCVHRQDRGRRARHAGQLPPGQVPRSGGADRLCRAPAGTARLRPDMKPSINPQWGDPQSRLNGLTQHHEGLSAIVRKADKREKVEA